MMVLLVLSAIALALVSPAFALAATDEVYFTRRIPRSMNCEKTMACKKLEVPNYVSFDNQMDRPLGRF